MNPPPVGWLVCDGSAQSRTTYASLYADIGTSAGDGDGSTTFNLPDYRGRFLRGLDDGAGNDPDASTRTALNLGGNTGDAVGTLESGQIASHSHDVTDPGHSHGVNDPGHDHGVTDPGHFHYRGTVTVGLTPGTSQYTLPYDASSNAFPTASSTTGISIKSASTGISIKSALTGISIKPAGGSETRPVNVAVNYLIKY